jgi:hypothetical protein
VKLSFPAEVGHFLVSFSLASFWAVESASAAAIFTSGSTPVPSRLVFEMGLIVLAKGTPIVKWSSIRWPAIGCAPPPVAGLAVCDGIIFAPFLSRPDSILHLFCQLGRNVKLIQVRDRAVNHTGSRRSIDPEIDVRYRGTRRKGAQAEASYHSRLAIFDVQRPDGASLAVPFLDEEFQLERLALQYLQEFKAAGLVTE